MGKYIDADLLRKEIDNWKEAMVDAVGEYSDGVRFALEHFTFVLDSLQQDKKSVELELCSQTWWEERGWIMIPPDATIEGIDSLLKQVRKKLQQEQPEVDFKIEERKWVHDAVDNIFPEDGDFMSEVDFRKILKDTARHFYELGFNARKEESK